MGKSKISQEEKLLREARYAAALAHAKKLEKDAHTGNKKRKDVDVLVGFLALPPRRYELRSAESYLNRSYNLRTQIIGLVDHLFGRYPAPDFLYRSVLSPAGFQVMYRSMPADYDNAKRRLHQEWLMAALHGKSVAKAMSGVLTKKETHYFLKAPDHNGIEQNLFWAKCAAMGIDPDGSQFLTEWFGNERMLGVIGDRLEDMLRFYATAYSNLGSWGCRYVTDFIRTAIHNPRFSFKGRTRTSMEELSRTWHRTWYAGNFGELITWKPMLSGSWQHSEEGVTATAEELTSNQALGEEGQRQRHCVYLYAQQCLSGFASIATMGFERERKELCRLTIGNPTRVANDHADPRLRKPRSVRRGDEVRPPLGGRAGPRHPRDLRWRTVSSRFALLRP